MYRRINRNQKNYTIHFRKRSLLFLCVMLMLAPFSATGIFVSADTNVDNYTWEDKADGTVIIY